MTMLSENRIVFYRFVICMTFERKGHVSEVITLYYRDETIFEKSIIWLQKSIV